MEKYTIDHCRIGSLEMAHNRQKMPNCDHCRIGSLEMPPACCLLPAADHCRIGSLETCNNFGDGWVLMITAA